MGKEGIWCPNCDKPITDDSIIRRMMIGQLERQEKKMREKNEHISDYANYAIVEELIKILKELEKGNGN